jgi:hypothetical protein
MSATVTGEWANSGSPMLTGIIEPSIASVPVTTQHVTGNWMIAICGWVQTEAGQGVSVSVADDGFNRWEPLGAPTGDSDQAGSVRCSVWYAPAARVGRVGNQVGGTTTVMCAPTGPVLALGMIVIDVHGMNPWDQLAFIPVSAFAEAAASIALTGTAPVASSFAVTAAVADASTSLTLTGSGWTPLTGTSVTGGVSPLTLAASYKTMNAANNVTWTPGATADLAAIMGAVVVLAAAPTAPNPDWPIVITEAAPGCGPSTPPSEISWVVLSSRSLAFSCQQGQPYLLGGLQAATGGVVIDNPDLAVTPPGNGVWAGIDSGTPLRVRMIVPALATPHYVRFGGYFQNAPTSFDTTYRGVIESTVTDAFAYATAALSPCLSAELLTDPSLYALWPCTDPAGSAGASNLAPGNQNPLSVVLSKYGNGATTQAFDQNSGVLPGDSGSGFWGQSGVANPQDGHGNSLHCADGNYPPISDGVTLEVWPQMSSATPPVAFFMTAMNSKQNILAIMTGNSGTDLTVIGYQNETHFDAVNISSIDCATSPIFHVAVAFNRTEFTVYVNGAAAVNGSWGYPLPAAFSDLWCNGNWAAWSNQGGADYNGYTAYAAVYSSMLSPVRIMAHYQAGALAFAGEYAHQRIERILGYAGLTGLRVIVPEAPGMPGGFTTTGTPDVTPMSSMATLGGSVPSLAAPGKPGFTPSSGVQANQALSDTAASTVPAVFAVAPTGAFFYYPRGYAATQPTRWTLGDDVAAGEIPVWPGAIFPYDPGTVKNDIQLTQPDTGSVTVPGLPEAGSVAQYGDQSYQVTAYLLDDASAGFTGQGAMTDLANWIACACYGPRMRAQCKVVASASDAELAWGFVAGVAPGDIVTVNARPPTAPAGTVISVTARVVQVKPALTYDMDSVEGSCEIVLDVAPEINTLTCDDVVQGVLNGVNCLGW